MAADSENTLRESMDVYFAEPDRRTSENSVNAKFAEPHTCELPRICLLGTWVNRTRTTSAPGVWTVLSNVCYNTEASRCTSLVGGKERCTGR
jgi:hypothetical protein